MFRSPTSRKILSTPLAATPVPAALTKSLFQGNVLTILLLLGLFVNQQSTWSGFCLLLTIASFKIYRNVQTCFSLISVPWFENNEERFTGNWLVSCKEALSRVVQKLYGY